MTSMDVKVWLLILAICLVAQTRTKETSESPLMKHLMSQATQTDEGTNIIPKGKEIPTRDTIRGTRATKKVKRNKFRRAQGPFVASFGPPIVDNTPFRPSDPDLFAGTYPPSSGQSQSQEPALPEALDPYYPVPQVANRNLYATGPWFLHPQFNVFDRATKKGQTGSSRRVRGRASRRQDSGKAHDFHSVVNYGVVNIHHANHFEPHHNGRDDQSQVPEEKELFPRLNMGDAFVGPAVQTLNGTEIEDEGSLFSRFQGSRESDGVFVGSVVEEPLNVATTRATTTRKTTTRKTTTKKLTTTTTKPSTTTPYPFAIYPPPLRDIILEEPEPVVELTDESFTQETTMSESTSEALQSTTESPESNGVQTFIVEQNGSSKVSTALDSIDIADRKGGSEDDVVEYYDTEEYEEEV